jgi:hypothetical protein
MTGQRHSWSGPSRPSELRTERVCVRCGLLKVTRHDGGTSALPWVEFYEAISGLLIETERTPRCEPADARSAA